MLQVNRHIPTSAIVAIVVHAIAFLLLIVGFQMTHKSRAVSQPQVPIVNASIIDGQQLAKQQEERTQAEERKREKEIKKREEEARHQAELKAAEQRKREEQEAKRAAEAKRQAELAEAKRQEQLEQEQARQREEAQRAAEAKRQAELKAAEERKRQAEAHQRAEEKKRQAEERARLEAERKAAERKAEEQRLAAVLAEEEAAVKAAQEKQRVAYEQRLKRLRDQYVANIADKIQRSWRKPYDAKAGDSCTVDVTQAPGGFVKAVKVIECTGNEIFRRSVVAAVWKADPLPSPPQPEVFDRQIHFTFTPEG
jgi:colicin import membrane protein